MRCFDPPEGKAVPGSTAGRGGSGTALPSGDQVRRTTDRAIWLLVLAFLVLGMVYSVVTPLFEASDELWHYPFVQHLATGGGLPVQDPAHLGPWRQEGSQPPLYYALAALVTRWVPADDLSQILVRNPHADIGIPRPDGNANMVIHTPREAWPYRGATLAVHLARGLSVILGALTVLFTYGIGLEVLPRRPGLALAAAAIVAFTPMFLFISGSVNNDNLLVTLSTIAFWLLLRLLRRPPTPAGWALLGGVIGLAALTKVSALGLLPMAALALAWLAWRRRDWKLFLWGGTCVAGTAVLVAGWWYVRNWLLYRDPLGFNAFVAIVGARYPRPTLLQLMGEWQGFIMAYWGFFGGVNVAAPAWFYRAFNAVALLGLGGLVAGAVRRLVAWGRARSGGGSRTAPTGADDTVGLGGSRTAPTGMDGAVGGGGSRTAPTDWDTVFRLGLVALWPIVVMAGLIRWTLLTIASQGRLLFPAIASLSFLLVLGLSEWLPRSMLRNASNVKRQTSSVKRETSDVKRQASSAASSSLTFDVLRLTLDVSPIILFAALAIWAPFGVIAPAYARPPLLTTEQQAAIPQRLDLAVGDGMELLGYEIGASEARPGQDLAVTLYWRARAPMPEDYSVFVHLLTDNDLIIGQRDVYPGCGSFPTSIWQPGDAIADTYVIPVSPTAFSPSPAVLEVGLYHQPTGARLPIRDGGGTPIGDHTRFGQVLVRAEPRDGIANPLDFNFDNKMALVGYDLDRTALRPGETLHLTLYWQALAPMAKDYTVFAHVLGANDSIWAQKDAWPLDGAAPTSSWQVGQVIVDRYDLLVKPETPGGVYDIEVGVYLGETLERLSVLGAGGHAQDNRVLLNRVRVVP